MRRDSSETELCVVMLIRFGVENFLSFGDYQELSLVASAIKDNEASLIKSTAIRQRLLPVALVYGANASGKSNLLAALGFMRSSVMLSQRSASPTGGVPRRHFSLDPAKAKKPSRFDIDFILDNTRYHFGFTCDDSRFLSEWLYFYPSAKRQILYYRKNPTDIEFGRNLRGNPKVIQSLTRENSLFISAAAQNAHVLLTPIYEWFSGFEMAMEIDVNSLLVRTLFPDGVIDPRIISFLSGADTGVVGAEFSDEKKSKRVSKFEKGLIRLMKENFAEDEQSAKRIEKAFDEFPGNLRLGHQSTEGGAVYMDLDFESAGTRRLLQLLKKTYTCLEAGSLLIVDELDSSLHTQLAAQIVKIFNNSRLNSHGAQLVATTHDTNLLSDESLRRDEVWLVEKNRHGETALYPLTDINTRRSDNLEKGYLQGRYGAVPFSGSALSLMNEIGGE